jgi:DNA-binding winged helix-turn-helix (wHTH) protein
MLDLAPVEVAAVEEAVHPRRLVRFGTFEVDLQSGELRKSGLKLKLTGQPFQVLAVFLERPGEVVTREELHKRLWPDTFVDVDHNLNTAINKIREVLGDSAENPRFVETLPRRGYRFIAPLGGAPVAVVSLPPISGVECATTASGNAHLSAVPHRANPPTKRSGLRYSILASAVLASAALLAYALTLRLLPPSVTGSAQVTSDAQGKSASYVQELASPLV